MLADMHFRTLRSKAKLVEETERVTKEVEVNLIVDRVLFFIEDLFFSLACEIHTSTEISRAILREK